MFRGLKLLIKVALFHLSFSAKSSLALRGGSEFRDRALHLEGWEEHYQDCASQKTDWADITKPNAEWKARNDYATRGIENATKRAHLNSYLTYVATFAPGSFVHDMHMEMHILMQGSGPCIN